MSFTDLLPSLVVGDLKVKDESALVLKFSACPPKVKGFKVSKDVKSLVIEWAETMQEELRKTPGMEKVVILPNWGRDTEAMQRVYMMCGEDKEAVRQMATIFWTHDKWAGLEHTCGMFSHCSEQILLQIAKMKRESAD